MLYFRLSSLQEIVELGHLRDKFLLVLFNLHSLGSCRPEEGQGMEEIEEGGGGGRGDGGGGAGEIEGGGDLCIMLII